MADLNALVLVCTLKQSPAPSSAQLIGSQVLDQIRAQADGEVQGEVVRIVDHHVSFGVSTDEGEGDEWPQIREKVLAADILVLATPIWLGNPSSVCRMVLERLDAEISETDDEGRLLTFGKVAAVAVVGNEDGAHNAVAQCLQGLNDVGFSAPPNCGTYWVGEAMQGVDYNDHDRAPEKTASTNAAVARNAVHLAQLLKANPYPPQP